MHPCVKKNLFLLFFSPKELYALRIRSLDYPKMVYFLPCKCLLPLISKSNDQTNIDPLKRRLSASI